MIQALVLSLSFRGAPPALPRTRGEGVNPESITTAEDYGFPGSPVLRAPV
jgi:hypothetical protein